MSLIVRPGVGINRKMYKPRRRVTRKYRMRQPYVEMKSLDVAINAVNDTTGAITLLNGCVRGDDIGDRDGRQIMMKSIQTKLTTAVTAGTGADQVARLLIVYDKQANQALPAITEVLRANSVDAMSNLNNRGRYRILMDKTYTLNASGESGSKRHTKMYRKINLRTTFDDGVVGDVTDITTGSLFLITMGSLVAGNTAGATTGNVRIRFQD